MSHSNILFTDGFVLECPMDDIASFANDAINFKQVTRRLLQSLNSTDPFYRKHSNTQINARIKTDNSLHKAFLVAFIDIIPNKEIFCHYGFQYWFKREITKNGFIIENEIEQFGFPTRLFDYPAFTNYINDFYPNNSEFKINIFKNNFVVIIYFDDCDNIVMPIDSFAKYINKVKNNDFDT